MFYFFLLNSIADKDSRFNSGVQFHLMVPVSFPFRIQICGTVVFFLSAFSFTVTRNSQGSRGRAGTIFYFALPLPPAHEHSDI